jgi:hypothetical protein
VLRRPEAKAAPHHPAGYDECLVRDARVRLPTLLTAVAVILLQRPEVPPWGRLDDESPAEAEHAEFHFTRAVYSGYWGRSWATDYPKADRQLMIGVRRLLNQLDASAAEHPVRLDDPDLNQFPFVYAVEVGHMQLSESEVQGLRRYLQAGGFLVVDDFWGSVEWANFESEMRRVLPDRKIVDLPRDHPFWSAFYDIKEVYQVPNIRNAMYGQTSEQDGFEPYYRGIFDDKGRLMVMINANTDLGDAWEWAERPEYPLKYSTFAYQMAVNSIVYGLSH